MEPFVAQALACTYCRKNFAYCEAGAVHGSYMPIILPCGHAICVICAGSYRDGLKCGECGIVAQRRLDIHKSGFPPHLGIIGGLMISAAGKHLHQNIPVRHGLPYLPAGAPLDILQSKQKTVDRGKCNICKFDLAVLRCINCSINYCQACKDLRHKQGEGQMHRIITLNSRKSRPTAPQVVLAIPEVLPMAVLKPRIFCLEHPEQKLDFLCEECNISICAYCKLCVEGVHYGHHVAFVGELEPKYKPRINELLLEAKEVQKELEHSIQILNDESKLGADWEALDKRISQHVAWQFAQVQLNGMRLRAELAAAKAAKDTHHKLIDSAVQNLQQIKGLMDFGKSYEPCKSLWLMQSLEEVCAAPCRIFKQDNFECVRLSLDKETFLDAMETGAVLEIPDGFGMGVFPRKETVPDGWSLIERKKDEDGLAKQNLVPESPSAPTEPLKNGAASMLLAALVPPMEQNGGQIHEASTRSSQNTHIQSLPSNKHPGHLPPGASEIVKISHVVDPFDFYVIRECDEAVRDEVTKKIQQTFRKLPTPETVSCGTTVLAKYEGDGRWYRALVTSVELRTVRVHFMDYGNTGTVALECIRTLAFSVSNVPPLAIHCCLNNAHPFGGEEWSNAAIKWFIKIADGNRLMCHVCFVEAGISHVDLGEISGKGTELVPKSVADAAVFMHFAQFIVEPAVNDEELELPPAFSRHPKVTYSVPSRWHVNERFLAKVSHVEEADCFYVHRQDAVAGAEIVRLNNELTKLCQPLFDAGGDGENLPVTAPKKGMACAALFSVDAVWYRALVTELLEERRVKVFFVDYGNWDIVSHDNIRHLPVRFATAPPLAIECSLHGIKPAGRAESFSQAATEMVDELTIDHVNELTVRKVLDFPTRYEVLLINGAGLNVARQLTLSMLAVRTGATSIVGFDSETDSDEECSESTVLPNKPQPHEVRSSSATDRVFSRLNGLLPLDDDNHFGQAAMEDVIHKPIRPEAVTDATLTEIVFVKCVTPDQIFISLKSAVYHFSDMKVSMELYYAKSVPTDCSWSPGDRCAALRSSDRSWHRGIVREVDNDAGVALIELRDIVCRERVPLSLLRPLDESFTRVREAIFTVCLGGVMPAGGSTWTHQAMEFAIRWTGIHRPTHIIKRGKITDGRLPVELLSRETVLSGALEPAVERFVSLNKELVANGLALPVRGAQEWPTWSSVDVTKEVEESVEVTDWTFPNQGAEDPPVADPWPGVPTDQPLQPGSWLPIEAVDMIGFEAIPTNVDNNGYIYLHSVHDTPTLKSMTDQLQRQFNSASPPPKEFVLRPGMPCVTRFHHDKLWYRAETIRERSGGRWEVLFVDYGSRDTLPSSEIWPTTFLSEIPVVCRKVALANIRPISQDGHWTRDGLDMLHVLIVEKQCTVHLRCPVGTPDPTTVLLMRDDGVNISTEMVSLGYARYADVKPGMVPGLPPLRLKRKPRNKLTSVVSDHGSELESEHDSELGADSTSTPGPVSEPESRDEQPSPDIIECDDEDDEVDEGSLVEAPIRMMTGEESFDLPLEDTDLETLVELDDTLPVQDLVEINDSVDSTVGSESDSLDDEVIVEDECFAIGKIFTDRDNNNESVIINSESEILSNEDQEEHSNNEVEIRSNDVEGGTVDHGNEVILYEDDDLTCAKDSDDNRANASGSDEDEVDVHVTTMSAEDSSKATSLGLNPVEGDVESENETDSAADLHFRYYKFPSGDWVDVVVQAVDSFKTVRVIPQDPLSLDRLEKLHKLVARIQKEAPLQPVFSERTLQSTCTAQFGDGQWRRTIFAGSNDSGLNVWDVDNSCWENVPFDRVHKCRRDWTMLPTLAAAAELQDASAKVPKDALVHNLQGKTFTAHVISRTPELVLQLYIKGTTTLAIEPLIKNGLVELVNMD